MNQNGKRHPIFMSIDFDKQAIWDQEIQPLVEQLHKLCGQHRIPYVLAACTKNDAEHKSLQGSQLLLGPRTTPVELNFCADVLNDGFGAKTITSAANFINEVNSTFHLTDAEAAKVNADMDAEEAKLFEAIENHTPYNDDGMYEVQRG